MLVSIQSYHTRYRKEGVCVPSTSGIERIPNSTPEDVPYEYLMSEYRLKGLQQSAHSENI